MNKRAQIGSTVSWFVAILVIFLILLIFLVFSSALAVQKISFFDKPVFSKDNSAISYSSLRGAEVFLESPDKDGKTQRQKIIDSSLDYSLISSNEFSEEDLGCSVYFSELSNTFAGASCYHSRTQFLIVNELLERTLVNISLIDTNFENINDRGNANAK